MHVRLLLLIERCIGAIPQRELRIIKKARFVGLDVFTQFHRQFGVAIELNGIAASKNGTVTVTHLKPRCPFIEALIASVSRNTKIGVNLNIFDFADKGEKVIDIKIFFCRGGLRLPW